MDYNYDDTVGDVVEDDGCVGNEDSLEGHGDAEDDNSMEDDIDDTENDSYLEGGISKEDRE